MITFETLRFQNFMSYGNQWTEIDLNKNKNTLIVGKNGSGKSTFLDALTFALFGKPFRNINKPQLINSIIDKNMLVEIEFKIGKKSYRVKRGMKPNIFDIYLDGELLKQDSLVRDYQSILENDILKINYKSFCQIVVLGSGNYVPFMQLPAAARRNIIEDLLDLQVFSTMNVILKERSQTNREELDRTDQEIKTIDSNLELHEEHIKSIKRDLKKEAKELDVKIDEALSKIKEAETQLLKSTKQREHLENKIKGFNKYTTRKNEIIQACKKMDSNKATAEKQKKFYVDSCNCPTCKQEIDEKFKEKMINSFDKTIAKCDKNLEIGKESIKKLDEKLDEKELLSEELSEIINHIVDLSTKLFANKQLHKTYMESKAKLINKIGDIDYTKKEELEEKLKAFKESKKKLVEHREILSIASQLLKDGGIKTLIIRQYIPIMNKIINQYLNHMNFFIEFNLDENFNEVIKSRHRDDFSYSSFSEGEKARINLAILFAWRAIAKMRNTSSTNILVFDEIFDGSLDNDGTDDFMKILQQIVGDTNVFIISHKVDAISDKFSSVLRFDKVKNFSRCEAA